MILPPDELAFFAAACDEWPSGIPFWTEEAGELSDALRYVNSYPSNDPKGCDPFVRLAWLRWRKSGRLVFDAGDVGEAVGIAACMYVVAKGSRWLAGDLNMVPKKVAQTFMKLIPEQNMTGTQAKFRQRMPSTPVAGIVGPRMAPSGRTKR